MTAGARTETPSSISSETPPSHATRARASTLRAFGFVVLSTFAVFNVNFRELGLADTIGATLLPVSLLRDGDLVLDEFKGLLESTTIAGVTLMRQAEWTLALREIGGELRSSYPVGSAVLAVPFYVLPTLFGWLDTYDAIRFTAKLAASTLVALSAGFFFLSLRRECTHRVALFWTLAYALGTGVCTIASQALWQHGPALFCLSVAVWAIPRLDASGRTRDALIVSAMLAGAVICRPQNVLASAPLFVWAMVRRRDKWLPLALPALTLAAWQVSYNLRVFDNPLGGYPALYESTAHSWRHLDSSTVMTLPLFEGLANLLLSPGKGLFAYSPFLLLGMIALPVLAVTRRLPIAWPLSLWVLGFLIVYGKNVLWWGGSSYGPRYLTELSLPLVLGLGAATPIWSRSSALRGGAVTLVVYGVAVQMLGLFTWECGWHVSPTWLDADPGRVWQWRDPEIVRCARVLAEEGPKPPDLGPFAH